MDWVALEVDQTTGGVLIMWDKRALEKMEAMVGSFSVSVKWQGVVDGFIWACLGVYGPNDNNERGHVGLVGRYSTILEDTVVLFWRL